MTGTKDVQIHSYKHSDSIEVNLIDTPGFDDDSLTDADVLEKISGYLKESYDRKITLNGLLYLHRITDNRMQGSSMKNLAVFKKLCGPDALHHVTFVTTMWDKESESCREEFEGREKELLTDNKFWATMIQPHGACTGRHNNTRQSAMDLLARFIQQPESTVVTDLQRELVDDKLRLDETAAGKVVMSGINKAAERAEKELRGNKEAREDLASAAREEKAAHKAEQEADTAELEAQWAELLAEKAELEAKLRKLKEQEEKLRKAEMESSKRWNCYFRVGCVLAVGSGAAVAAVASGAAVAVPVILKDTILVAAQLAMQLATEENETAAT